MHLSLIFLCASLISSIRSAPLSPIQGYLQQASQTKLLGSSFGVLGTDQTFDYVIIGGGTAGLTLATRLAEAHNNVAVVEAGSFYELDNGNLSQIPSDDVLFTSAAPLQTSIQPLVDWGFISQPQPILSIGTEVTDNLEFYRGSSIVRYITLKANVSVAALCETYWPITVNFNLASRLFEQFLKSS
ncbi:MAG: hypothetical protein ASARMPRED_004390 [Alectoria sarmentosa]|nr:MAG: hypothetical protein ASARMPRED_004390 [Alectoria sarmentosa]